MTYEEMKEIFPIGSKIKVIGVNRIYVVANHYDRYRDFENGCLAIRYQSDQNITVEEYVDPEKCELSQPENHNGMIYNHYTKRWSWF